VRLLDSLRRRGPRGASLTPAAPSAHEDGLPIAGYDRLRADRVTEQLHQLSQSELASIEAHERSHQDRQEVLDKLRYLRGSEPLPDYDGLDAGEVSTALKSADLDAITRVREYEMKFQRRDDVLGELARVRRERKAGDPS
jgi:hypothetical protein